MNQEVRHKIYTALLGALLVSLSVYATSRSLAGQAGRLLGLAGLVTSWLAVLLLVWFGVLSPTEGLMQTSWVCGGAVVGVLLHLIRPVVVAVKIDERGE